MCLKIYKNFVKQVVKGTKIAFKPINCKRKKFFKTNKYRIRSWHWSYVATPYSSPSLPARGGAKHSHWRTKFDYSCKNDAFQVHLIFHFLLEFGPWTILLWPKWSKKQQYRKTTVQNNLTQSSHFTASTDKTSIFHQLHDKVSFEWNPLEINFLVVRCEYLGKT